MSVTTQSNDEDNLNAFLGHFVDDLGAALSAALVVIGDKLGLYRGMCDGTPASRAQEVGLALGAQAGERRLRDVVTAGGFTRFRRAAETPFNIVLEARP
jgi:hypothetical protein